MKNRLIPILLAFPMVILLMRCVGDSCSVTLGAIQYDDNSPIYPGYKIELNALVNNTQDCAIDYVWSSSAGRIEQSNNGESAFLITDCAPNNHTITLSLKNKSGKVLDASTLEITSINLDPLVVRDFYNPSGYFGDVEAITTSDVNYQRKEAEKFTYTPGGSQGFAGVYYQYPENNWGDFPGKDLSGYNKLRFEACSPNTATINFIAGGVADGTKEYKDSFKGVT
ncbi:MAG: hypothetical protein AAF242_09715, partial [Bacteroidota bacterium]